MPAVDQSVSARIPGMRSGGFFLRLFLPLALLLAGGAYLYGTQEVERELTQLRIREAAGVKLGAGALSGKIKGITQDLLFLSWHRDLRDALDQPTAINIGHLAENFTTFSRAKGIYDQIRWLDETGMERVRVDQIQDDPVEVPANKLQNKADRYYFADALKLAPGEVFISPLDLNIEHKKIEVPHKPMIRIATPVTDGHGRQRGIVILNYLAGEMLESFATVTADNADHGMVINAEGYWLKSPNAADEWGFMLERPELSMTARAPAAWQRMTAADRGQLLLADGLWTWETTYPLLAGQKSSAGTPAASGPSRSEIEAHQYYWKAVSHVSADKLGAIRQAVWLKIIGIASLLLGLLALGSWKLTRAWSMLAEAEEEYKTIADFAYDWETWIDPAGNYIYCSPSCTRLTGWPAEAFLSNPDLLAEITHPDDRARMENHLALTKASDGACELVVRIVLPDGQVRWMEHVCQPVFSATGKYLGRRASNRDISERKKAVEALQENEERLRLAFEAAKQGWFDVDLGSGAVSVSPEYARMIGYAPEEFHSDLPSWLQQVHPDDRATVSSTFNACVADGGPYTMEYRRRTKGGDWKWLRSIGKIVQRDDTGKALRMIGIHTDISSYKAIDAELEQHRHHLEALVAERTSDLALAKEVAEAASRAKSTFLSNMSHELRTPLSAIIGMTGLAMKAAAEPRLTDRLNKIDRASKHLLTVINDILDISKIEAERLTLEQNSFRFGLVLENLMSVIGQKVAEKGLKVLIDLPSEIAQAVFIGDPLRLGQVLLNLTSNAVKFTEQGAITLRARLVEETPGAALLRIEVQDSGIGISATDQQRLFTAFEQADGSMTRKYGGTGLGLAISKRLIHLMGGEIGVESAPGQGSTFWFTVRLGKASAAEEPAATQDTLSAEIHLKDQYAGTRILLAEDEPINQEVSRGLLEEVGFNVDLAADGAAAVELATHHEYDLILMDMQMPHLNGMDATRAIRALPGHARTPILAMTANAFEEDRQVCFEAGMNDHIGKPVVPEVLFATLLKWLQRPER